MERPRLQRLTGAAAGHKSESQNRLSNFIHSKHINIPSSLGQKIKDKNMGLATAASAGSTGTETAGDSQQLYEESRQLHSPAQKSGAGGLVSDSEVFIKFNGKEATPVSGKKIFTGSMAEVIIHKEKDSNINHSSGIGSTSNPPSLQKSPSELRSPLTRQFSSFSQTRQHDASGEGGGSDLNDGSSSVNQSFGSVTDREV
jgi:hypothetical protein